MDETYVNFKSVNFPTRLIIEKTDFFSQQGICFMNVGKFSVKSFHSNYTHVHLIIALVLYLWYIIITVCHIVCAIINVKYALIFSFLLKLWGWLAGWMGLTSDKSYASGLLPKVCDSTWRMTRRHAISILIRSEGDDSPSLVLLEA